MSRWLGLALTIGLPTLCLAAVLVGGRLLDEVVSQVGPAMVWEFLAAFYLVFLADLRGGGTGTFLSCSFVVSVTVLVLLYAVFVELEALAVFGVLTLRHWLSETGSDPNLAALPNLVRYLFAAIPAALVAYWLSAAFGIDFERGAVLFAAGYFVARALYAHLWDPHEWLQVEWRNPGSGRGER